MTGLANSTANTPYRNAKNDMPERFLLVIIIIVGSLISGFKLAGPAPDYRNYQSQYLIEAFVALLAACTCTLKVISLSKTDGNRLVLLALYGSYLFWLHDYVQVRIALALSIGLYGVYAETKLRYVFLLIAALIHSSFVIIVAAYILIFVGTRRPVVAIIAVIIFTAVLFSQDIFTQSIQRVNEYQYGAG
jgi:hypothetical protein